jgi:oxaloacetate decarboxylase alpha subunit
VVRQDLGYPPLVTPMSQIVGVQATINVLYGERYSNISNELKSYLRGEYGKAPGELNQELVKRVLGDDQPITGRYADNLEPEFEKTKQMLGTLAENDEDVLSYIAFPQIAEKFFREREDRAAVKVNYAIKRV